MEHLEFLIERSKLSREAYEETISDGKGLDNNLKAAFFVDPGTVIAAVETGYKIYSFFKKSSKNDKLIKYLRAQFKEIKELLNTVISRLDELKVTIADESRKTAVNELEANVRIFSESYDDWYNQRKDPKIKEIVEHELSNLRNFVNRCEDRGYAHYDTIWIAIIYQIAAMDLLDYNDTQVGNILTNHIDLYFEDARNPHLPGSVVYQRNLKALEIKKFSLKYPAFTHTNTTYDSEGCWNYVYQQKLIITGDIYQGFSITLEPRKLVDKTRDDCHPHRSSENSTEIEFKNEAKGLYSNINFKATIAVYEAAYDTYEKKMEPEFLTLVQAGNAVDKYISILTAHLEQYHGDTVVVRSASPVGNNV